MVFDKLPASAYKNMSERAKEKLIKNHALAFLESVGNYVGTDEFYALPHSEQRAIRVEEAKALAEINSYDELYINN